MIKYPFSHNGPVFTVSDDDFEVAYYSRDGHKYKRIRRPQFESFDEVNEQEINHDVFWMVIACIERSRRHA